MFGGFVSKVKNKAAELKGDSSSVDTNEKTQQFNIKETGSELWDKFYPKFEKTVVNGFLDVAEDKLKKEEDLELIIHKIYELLPMLIRLTISRDFFVEKVLLHKIKILEKVSAAKQERLQKSSDQNQTDINLIDTKLETSNE